MTKSDDKLKCSFCGKGQNEVKKLICGPAVSICNECIDFCNEALAPDDQLIAIQKRSPGEFSHVDPEGRIKMVDVGEKPVTQRSARASGLVEMSAETVAAIRAHRTPKGDPLETARLAGIMAAKRTADLIPLCHPLALTHVDVQIDLLDDGARISATASTGAQTGVEMEALTAVSVAALTLYDMCKAIDRGMTIKGIRLEKKSGGRSGEWRRETD